MSVADEALSQALIRHQADDVDRAPLGAFRAAQSILSERFGNPRRLGTSNAFVWEFPTTTIELETFFIEGVVSEVPIRFFPSAPGASKPPPAAF